MSRIAASAIAIPAAVAALALAAGVRASSPDAWDKMRAQLVQACIAEAGLPQPRIVVAPEGTASYGVALLTSDAVANEPQKTVVCIMRKTPEGLRDVEVTPPATEWIAIER